MNVCPSHKNLVSAKIIKASDNVKNNFFSNKFELIDDEKTAHIKEIRANTPDPFSMLLLGCHNWKNQPQNYCNKLFNPQAVKKACESNKTDYVFFYINKWFDEKSENKPKEDPVYILAFVRYSKDEEIPKKIIAEVKRTAEWLCISGSTIQCYVFYYTANFLCNTFNWGTFKKKYDDQCMDPKYIFQFKYVPPNKKPQYISVNGGSPKFTIEVQEM
jgi:hypothetical protein